MVLKLFYYTSADISYLISGLYITYVVLLGVATDVLTTGRCSLHYYLNGLENFTFYLPYTTKVTSANKACYCYVIILLDLFPPCCC